MDHSTRATPQDGKALTRLAMSATLHCLTGCAIGEVLGMVIGTALGWSDLQTIALAIALAFVFGYALTKRPILRSGLALAAVIPVALAADTLPSPSWRSSTTPSCCSSPAPWTRASAHRCSGDRWPLLLPSPSSSPCR